MTAKVRVKRRIQIAVKYWDSSIWAGLGPLLTDSGGRISNHALSSDWIFLFFQFNPAVPGGGWGWGFQAPPFIWMKWAHGLRSGGRGSSMWTCPTARRGSDTACSCPSSSFLGTSFPNSLPSRKISAILLGLGFHFRKQCFLEWDCGVMFLSQTPGLINWALWGGAWTSAFYRSTRRFFTILTWEPPIRWWVTSLGPGLWPSHIPATLYQLPLLPLLCLPA